MDVRHEAYRRTFAAALAAVQETERSQPPAALVEAACAGVVHRPSGPGGHRLRHLSPSRLAELCRQLLAMSHALRFDDPARMVELARAAVEGAALLPQQGVRALMAIDLGAEAWAGLANAQRVAGDLRAAAASWLRADEHLARGSGDPLLRARLFQLKAHLRSTQLRHGEATALNGEAFALYERLGERHLAGRALLCLARVHRRTGRVDEAIRCLVLGLQRIDARRERSLVLVALHNLAAYLEETGFPCHALAVIEEIRPLYALQPGSLPRLRLSWLEGRLSASLGWDEEAARAFDAVRRVFVEQGMAYDAALACLDLAAAYVRLGRLEEVASLAAEMYPVFVSRDIHREAAAVLVLFARAAEKRVITAEWIGRLASRLREVRERSAAAAAPAAPTTR